MRARLGWITATLLAICMIAAPADAQGVVDDSPDGLLESYLRTRGLDRLLAAHLDNRLAGATGTDRIEIAERLGRVYAGMLSESDSSAERDELIRLSNELLERVPAADTFDLRIALIKARYLTAEESAERVRLRLASDAERREAVGALDDIAAALGVLGDRADRRVQALERRERSGTVTDLPELRAELAEARRERSLAKYYAGWSLYYTAMLTGRVGLAGDALESLGFLLGADGDEPTLDKLPRSLLRYEHVARAAIGAALCHGLRGDHVSAILWLDEIEQSDDVHPGVLNQLFTRRVTILADARRWDALARAVEERRGARLGERASSLLRVAEARLVAIEVLGALRAPDADAQRREAAEPIVQAALADLIARGDSAQVLDLVERFGTLPIGDDGFIARYVRGLRAYKQARALHAESGEDEGSPTRQAELVAAYLEAASLLTHAFETDDADAFADEHRSAGLMLGMALYYKDSPAQAADRFEQVVELSEPGPQHEDALWMGIVALERAIEQGRTELRPRLHTAAVLYVQTYPRQDRAARLLLRFAGDGLFDREMVLDVLMHVERASPLYGAARRHVADVLYRAYVGAREPRKSELAARFLPLAFEQIDAALRALRDPGARVEDENPVDTVLLRARQALDASLTPLAADPASARRALKALDELHARTGADVDADSLEGEFAYRRLQLAVAEDDQPALESAHRELAAIGGRFLRAADQYLFARAFEHWRASGRAEDARRVVDIGARLLGLDGVRPTIEPPAEILLDRSVLSVADSTAVAATALWRSGQDRDGLLRAVQIDRLVLREHAPTADLLRRLAKNAEDAGDRELALETWNRLMNALPAGGSEWYEARYESLRLLAELRPDEARRVLRQHEVLYPEIGPAPWGPKIEALGGDLNAGGGP